MVTAATTTTGAERPPRLVFVYTWDIVRAVLAMLAALAAFSGGIDANGRAVPISLPEQLLDAVSAGCYAAVLISLSVLLGRRQAWVRRAQLAVLGVSALLIVASLFALLLTGGAYREAFIGNGLFLALDAAAVWSLTRADAGTWYLVPGVTPRYISFPAAFWAASSAAIIVITFLH